MNKKFFTLLILVIIILPFNLFAQKNMFTSYMFSDGKKELPYRLLVPQEAKDSQIVDDFFTENVPLYPKNAGEKYPLILFLHGAGERGSDNQKQLTYIDVVFGSDEFQAKNPCYVLAPQCPNELRWVEVDWSADSHLMPNEPSYSMDLTIKLLDKIIAENNIDTDRIYITGLSMGGYGTWDMIARYPNKFAAAVPICGGGDENTASQIATTPIWAFHGAKDKLVKPARSRNMIEALKQAGGTPKYTEFPNLGHLCWNEAYATPELFAWLFSQTLKK